MKKVHSNLCFECGACVQICANQAIILEENPEGFSYPIIDQPKCIDCGLCQKVCPGNHGETLKHGHLKVQAAQCKDKSILAASSSGGIFALISKYVLDRGGVVFGATWDEALNCHHIAVDNEKDLERLKGSKYVHSAMGNCYKQAKKYLRQGKYVYFTGTPCQIAGLRLFLRKEYDTLVTSDLICHGTPSQKAFDLFCRQMERELNVKLVNYNFRDKSIVGWNCSSSSSSVNPKGRKRFHIYDKNMQGYFNAFISGHITRMDCYQCPFAEQRRVGDITLADYWGIRKIHPNFPNIHDGVSLVIINTPKGHTIWDAIKEQMNVVESSMEKALNSENTNLRHPTPLPAQRFDAYKRAFDNIVSFRDSYLDESKRTAIYKMYYKKKLRKYFLFRVLLQIIGK